LTGGSLNSFCGLRTHGIIRINARPDSEPHDAARGQVNSFLSNNKRPIAAVTMKYNAIMAKPSGTVAL